MERTAVKTGVTAHDMGNRQSVGGAGIGNGASGNNGFNANPRLGGGRDGDLGAHHIKKLK